MRQVLEDNFCPSSISNTFTSLLALFNTTQGDKEGLHKFRLHFEGHVTALSQSLVAIPPILQVMLFLCALHSPYNDILTQFGSKQKDLASSTLSCPTLNLWTNLLWLGLGPSLVLQVCHLALPLLSPLPQTRTGRSVVPRFLLFVLPPQR